MVGNARILAVTLIPLLASSKPATPQLLSPLEDVLNEFHIGALGLNGRDP
jgi:hypothetical protein